MVLRFLCPNGHRLESPENLAGKPGKCPKCGATFRIPLPEELSPIQKSTEKTKESSLAVAESASSSGATTEFPKVGVGPALGSEYLEFLCPEGHHLHCLSSAAGSKAQCPVCGVKFRVPTLDELEGEITTSSSSEQSSFPASPSGSFAAVISTPQPATAGTGWLPYPASGTAPGWQPGGTIPTLATMLRRIFECRPAGTVVEIFLQGGGVLPSTRLRQLDDLNGFAWVELIDQPTSGHASGGVALVLLAHIAAVVIRGKLKLDDGWFLE